jgi:hypothetical protein
MANPSDSSAPSTDPWPEELRSVLVVEAELDADRVAALMLAMGYSFSPSKPLVMPPELLLFYGAVLRLRSWELADIPIHRDQGLPAACEILTNAARALAEERKWPDGTRLTKVVMNIFVNHFSWNARLYWNAPVALDSLDEDMALDALAELLLNRRLVARGGSN